MDLIHITIIINKLILNYLFDNNGYLIAFLIIFNN